MKLEVDAEGDEKKILYEAIRALPTNVDPDVGGPAIQKFIQQGIAKKLIQENTPALEGKGSVDIQGLISGLEEIKNLRKVENTTYSYIKEIETFHQVYNKATTIYKTGFTQKSDGR